MHSLASSLGTNLANPANIIYVVASSLLYPVLFYEVFALLWVCYHAGTFTLEAWQRIRARRHLDIESLEFEMSEAAGAGDELKAQAVLSRFGFGPVIGPVSEALSDGRLLRHRAMKLFIDAEQRAVRRLDKTRMYIRMGPILGLMGTLIPISPALVALAKGDTETLSANLVVAFSTTVVGLFIGSIAYVVSVGRERMYTQDMSDLQFVLDKSVK